jgi:hypothetical protein
MIFSHNVCCVCSHVVGERARSEIGGVARALSSALYLDVWCLVGVREFDQLSAALRARLALAGEGMVECRGACIMDCMNSRGSRLSCHYVLVVSAI